MWIIQYVYKLKNSLARYGDNVPGLLLFSGNVTRWPSFMEKTSKRGRSPILSIYQTIPQLGPTYT